MGCLARIGRGALRVIGTIVLIIVLYGFLASQGLVADLFPTTR